MGETSDHPTDMTILVKCFGTTPGEVGLLVATELVDLPSDVTKNLVVVQLAFLFLGLLAILRRLL